MFLSHILTFKSPSAMLTVIHTYPKNFQIAVFMAMSRFYSRRSHFLKSFSYAFLGLYALPVWFVTGWLDFDPKCLVRVVCVHSLTYDVTWHILFRKCPLKTTLEFGLVTICIHNAPGNHINLLCIPGVADSREKNTRKKRCTIYKAPFTRCRIHIVSDRFSYPFCSHVTMPIWNASHRFCGVKSLQSEGETFRIAFHIG